MLHRFSRARRPLGPRPTVESAPRTAWRAFARNNGVRQRLRGEKRWPLRLTAIVVAGEHDGNLAVQSLHSLDDLPDSLHYEPNPHLPRLWSGVNVGVDEADEAARALVAKYRIRADSQPSGVPSSRAGGVGGFRKPERARLQAFEPLLAPEYGRRLAGLAVGIASVTCKLVFRHSFFEEHQLVWADLLKPARIKVESAQEGEEVVLAFRPCVRRTLVGGRAADVIGAHLHRGGRHILSPA